MIKNDSKQEPKNSKWGLAGFHKKGIYPDFKDSIKRGKAPVDFEIENALLKRARGFEYEETYVEYKDFPKNKEKANPTLVRKVTKMIAPDVTACIFWLKNRMPRRWRDKQGLQHTDSDVKPLKIIFKNRKPHGTPDVKNGNNGADRK